MLTISLSRNTFIYRAPIDFLVRGSYVFNDPWFRDGSPMERKVGMDAQGASRNGPLAAGRVGAAVCAVARQRPRHRRR